MTAPQAPNSGILIGNGYTWTARRATPVWRCVGSNSRLLGNGGSGYNGGAGGSTSWFGDGGTGSVGVLWINGGTGGKGGAGG